MGLGLSGRAPTPVEDNRSFDDVRRFLVVAIATGSETRRFSSLPPQGPSLNLGMMTVSVEGVLNALSSCSKKRSFSLLLFHDIVCRLLTCLVLYIGLEGVGWAIMHAARTRDTN